MRQGIVGIGILVELQHYWQLIREPCGHTLEFPNFDDIEGWVRRHYDTCIECALWNTRPPVAER